MVAPLFSRMHTSLITVWRAISRAQVEVRSQWENGAPNKGCLVPKDKATIHTLYAKEHAPLVAMLKDMPTLVLMRSHMKRCLFREAS